MRSAGDMNETKNNKDKSDNALKGIKIEHYFSQENVDPYDTVEWTYRTAQITNEKNEIVFEQKDVEMPQSWSQLSTNVVVSKYFKGKQDTPERESSLRTVIGRVANTITNWGKENNYFASRADADRFNAELRSMILNQKMAFNSPVWFNVGVEKDPQCSACFINSVEDTMESILGLAKTEGMLFKFGSGTGSNLSSLRSSFESMSTGGYASGPVSFMKGYDAFAGVIKSGGKTRRAAKMVILNVDHPDIEDFIQCKVREEKKAQDLIKAGYDSSFNGEAYSSVFFQNANHSVRVTDSFMHAVSQDGEWNTRAVTDGQVQGTYKARDLMDKICQAAWKTGDPGFQYDTTINDWHTCSKSDRINASNPCSEFMFLDDTACNLASLNLMNFRDEEGHLDAESLRRAVFISIIAMEIIVNNASYPTKQIEKNSHDFRPLGLGYSNLGALLMSLGLPYDSEDGRAYAAAITALMHGEAYRTSAEIASHIGPFRWYKKNRKPFLRVMRKHADAVEKIDSRFVPERLLDAVQETYDDMLSLGREHGFRNAQVTVLAPTGTISFMMDCDTTGIEPDIALVKYKKLVGGGVLKIVNQTIPSALRRLGYNEKQIEDIKEYISKNDTIEGAPGIKRQHLPVFDCAFKPFKGTRSIHYMGHIRMMSAVQPFISGAISKTVNLPNNATTEDINSAYMTAWQLGLKAIAIYRDGCKLSQPLNTKLEDEEAASDSNEVENAKTSHRLLRHKLQDERKSITHKFSVGGHEGYITVGMYENGQPGEIFIVMSKEGSAVSGLMDSFATAVSIALQYGVPLKVLVRKFIHTRFEPSGFTNNREIPIAKSVMDYIFRWLALKFMSEEEEMEVGVGFASDGIEPDEPNVESGHSDSENKDSSSGNDSGKSKGKASNGNGTELLEEAQRIVMTATMQETFAAVNQSDAPPCPSCGAIMVRSGTCYKCMTCGSTSGCS